MTLPSPIDGGRRRTILLLALAISRSFGGLTIGYLIVSCLFAIRKLSGSLEKSRPLILGDSTRAQRRRLTSAHSAKVRFCL